MHDRHPENEDIASWHFPMTNDTVRNTAYENALASALKKGGVVLEIGSGSGLLAMLAIRNGASKVITCEEIPTIARKTVEIVKQNGFADKIQVINKLSTKLVVGQDFPERADVLLGERAFLAIGHAKEHLLKKAAQIIPAGARVICMCIESKEIFENHHVERAGGFDVSAFNDFSVKDDYVGYHLKKMNYRSLTAPKTVFEFDFNQIPSNASLPIEFEIKESGLFHAIVYWFELKLDANTTISTAPDLPQLSSWKQAVQLFRYPRSLEKGSRLKLLAHHNSEAIWFSGERTS